MKALLPRFAITSLDGGTAATRNTQLAATIYAFDVPFNEANPYETATGDGISGVRVTWHFEQDSPSGNSPDAIIKRWLDDTWLAANPSHPLAQCKSAFRWLKDMVATAKQQTADPLPNFIGGDSLIVMSNRQAACAAGVGHKFLGYSVRDGVYRWHLHRAAAADLALYEDKELHNRLPDENISYVRAALVNHDVLVGVIKHVQFFRVEHRGRSAMIGNTIPKQQLDKLERILYRK